MRKKPLKNIPITTRSTQMASYSTASFSFASRTISSRMVIEIFL
jgi:hypothetical protein